MKCVIEECLYNDLKDNCTAKAKELIPSSLVCEKMLLAKKPKRPFHPNITYRLSRIRGLV
jgi:hypothetical protein